MNIEAITLRNWRCFTEERRFEFDRGLNVLVGQNETGKSTLLDGLVRGFYEKHSGGNREIDAIRPHGSSLEPEVTVDFQIGEESFRIYKRFLGHKTSVLSKRRGDSFERMAEGDRADSQVRELVHGGERGSSRVLLPELRGLAQALWLLQTDADELPEKAWTQQVVEGIGGQVATAADSPATRAFVDALEKEFLAWFTDTGRVKGDGEWGRADTDQQRARAEFERLTEKSRAVDGLRLTIASLEDERRQLERSLAARNEAFESMQTVLESAEAFAARHAELEQNASTVRAASETIRKQYATLTENEASIVRLDEDLNRARTQSAQKRARHDAESARRLQILEVLSEQRPRRHQMDIRSQSLQAAHNLRKLQGTIAELKHSIARVDQIGAELSAMRADLASLRAPTTEEYRQFQSLHVKLIEANAQREFSAIRVQFALNDPLAQIDADPPLQSSGGQDFLITAKTTFTVKNVGAVTVSGGGKTVTELDSSLSSLRNARADLFDRYGIESDDDMERRNFEGGRLRDRIAGREKDLAKEIKQQPNLKDDLDRAVHGAAEEYERVQGLEEGWETWGGESIRKMIQDLEAGKKQLDDEIKRNEGDAERALAEGQRLFAEAIDDEKTIAALQAKRSVLEDQNGKIIMEYGSRTLLLDRNEQAARELELTESELARSTEDFAIRVTAPRDQYAVARRAIEDNRESIKALATQIGMSLGILDHEVGDGFAGKLADAEDELDEKQRRFEQIKLRGEGLKLLRELVRKERGKQAMALVQPVAELVNPWLRYLTNGRYDEMSIGANLLPVGLQRPYDHEPMPVDCLSRGAKEQTGLLVRLALAKLVGGSRPFPVVLDDRLVNTDPIRMDRFAVILRQIAAEGQMIVTTCDENRYAGLGGKVIKLELS